MAKRYDKKQQAARIMREQRKREQRRKQLIMGGAIVAVLVVVMGIIGVALYLNQTEEVVPPKAEHTESAIVQGDGPVTVDLYEDFMCPICKNFHGQVSQDLQQLVDEGNVTLRVHPIAILDAASEGTRYSTRSAAAAVCAADEGKFSEYTAELFANQPPERTPGLDDAELTKLGTDLGLGQSFSSCVADKTYRGWVQQATDTAAGDKVTATPTVFVNGEKVTVAPNQGIDAVIAQFEKDLTAALEAAGITPAANPDTGDHRAPDGETTRD
ncbi:thioredoxin-like protein [Stackebrandtia endophytica]|uniref:Thioredoxin-like protein n=1 Tax=Stackebrandtia endophytica TaxID=1496996 RepID=A0A543AT97_9ACTN|nr:thioredoxin domain-containing protein [Stackebrandtia endophytica]TQL75814.1 thioredoxin-like protein [Stackebrandtia endophytica]